MAIWNDDNAIVRVLTTILPTKYIMKLIEALYISLEVLEAEGPGGIAGTKG